LNSYCFTARFSGSGADSFFNNAKDTWMRQKEKKDKKDKGSMDNFSLLGKVNLI
jgi:hypothetical protein